MANPDHAISDRGVGASDPTPGFERRVAVLLILACLTTGALVALLQPGLVRFWPFTLPDFMQLLMPLLLIALFIERVVEVFLMTWRAAGARDLEIKVQDKEGDPAARRALVIYKSGTQRLALLIGTAVGVIVSGLGIRILELLLDPAVFRALQVEQRSVFVVADVLFTGAVLGGGADSVHKLVAVFTNFVDSMAAVAKERQRRV